MSAAATPLVVPTPRESMPDHYKAAAAARRREMRREMRVAVALSGMLALAAGWAGYLTWRNEKLVQLAAENANRVIYVTMRDDGVLVNSVMYTSLPPKWQTNDRLNTLWHYVFWRECYSESEAPRAYHNVQRMSDDRVSAEWREHMSLQNPTSPRNTHGKKRKHYSCDPINYSPIGTEDNRYSFRFMRHEHDERGRKDPGIAMYATVAFRSGVYPNDENAWIDKAVFNAPGIQVWEYPGARPEGVQQHLLSRAAADAAAQPASSTPGGRAR